MSRAELGWKGIALPFLALTNAPCLDAGIKLNIMAVPQIEGTAPARLQVGARLTIRLGHCCPDVVEGEITEVAFDHAVLTLGATEWILDPGSTGVCVPGIVSEDWIVRAAVRPARSQAVR